jgi:hypothetical protein
LAGLVETHDDEEENEDDDYDDEDEEPADMVNKEEAGKMVDCLILDSPFANFRGMIHDVIHSQYKVCGCCINIALSGVLKDCKKKIKKDLTLIKPIEAVPYIDVPAFYMVGKQDIIARPEKVKELFLQTKSKNKVYHTFEGEHPTHRDKYILKKAILFILNEFDRLGMKSIPSSIPKPTFADKKERQIFNKKIINEHKTELFIDPPVIKPPPPKNVTKPKYLSDLPENQMNLSNDPPKIASIKSNTPPIQPKQDIDSISNNLNPPKDIEKQPLNMSFSKNGPPMDTKDTSLPNGLPLGQEGIKHNLENPPIVTGNSSPK